MTDKATVTWARLAEMVSASVHTTYDPEGCCVMDELVDAKRLVQLLEEAAREAE